MKSLFLPGSVIDVPKGKYLSELASNRLPIQVVEGSEWTALPNCRAFGRDSIGHSLRQQAVRPGFPDHTLDRPDKRSASDAMGMAGGKDRSGPEGPGALAEAVSISSFRPDAIIIGYWKEVLAIEEDAEIYEVEYLEAA